MTMYKYRTQGKTTRKFKEKQDQKVEADMELAPNIDYNLHDIYKVNGTGVFDGKYRLKKVTHRIEAEGGGFTSTVTGVKLAD